MTADYTAWVDDASAKLHSAIHTELTDLRRELCRQEREIKSLENEVETLEVAARNERRKQINHLTKAETLADTQVLEAIALLADPDTLTGWDYLAQRMDGTVHHYDATGTAMFRQLAVAVEAFREAYWPEAFGIELSKRDRDLNRDDAAYHARTDAA